MKLMTFNTHSLMDEDYQTHLHIFINTLLYEKPHIIALQEVNQSCDADILQPPEDFIISGTTPVKSDNHALKVQQLLKDGGLNYHVYWEAVKLGYQKFDEGLAIFSLYPITSTASFTISQNDDYSSWKTRKCLFAQCGKTTVCNTHMGWWNDPEEPFSKEWERLSLQLGRYASPMFLMGDFNSPAHTPGEGYEKIISSGWHDTYTLARTKDEGFTISGAPDGWSKPVNARIDFIFTNFVPEVKKSYTIFSESGISDHSGVIINI